MFSFVVFSFKLTSIDNDSGSAFSFNYLGKDIIDNDDFITVNPKKTIMLKSLIWKAIKDLVFGIHHLFWIHT